MLGLHMMLLIGNTIRQDKHGHRAVTGDAHGLQKKGLLFFSVTNHNEMRSGQHMTPHIVVGIEEHRDPGHRADHGRGRRDGVYHRRGAGGCVGGEGGRRRR